MNRHELTDVEWEHVRHLLPTPAPTGRPPRDARAIVNGIVWLLKTGAPWRDLPSRFGPWQTVYHRLTKWRREGVWDRLVCNLQGRLDRRDRLDRDLWCVDGTVIRASRAAAGAGEGATEDGSRRGEPEDHALGRSQGGFSTKLHLVTDGRGLPLAVHVTPGQTHESKGFEPVMNAVRISRTVGPSLPYDGRPRLRVVGHRRPGTPRTPF